ncbi:hypothetical protein ACRAWF_04280 [Streptomyces sp. L7]
MTTRDVLGTSNVMKPRAVFPVPIVMPAGNGGPAVELFNDVVNRCPSLSITVALLDGESL